MARPRQAEASATLTAPATEGSEAVSEKYLLTEQAGVAKASLYNTFGSKDELVRAYLEGRHARRPRELPPAGDPRSLRWVTRASPRARHTSGMNPHSPGPAAGSRR